VSRGVVGSTAQVEIFIPLTELFDIEEEKKRLEKEIAKLTLDINGVNQRLTNSSFMERAQKEVVEKEKARHQELVAKKEKLEESLRKMLTGA